MLRLICIGVINQPRNSIRFVAPFPYALIQRNEDGFIHFPRNFRPWPADGDFYGSPVCCGKERRFGSDEVPGLPRRREADAMNAPIAGVLP
jgi:hypothetical protein